VPSATIRPLLTQVPGIMPESIADRIPRMVATS
jgi:hypothetical protein